MQLDSQLDFSDSFSVHKVTHSITGMRASTSFFPLSVMEYSTLGGISLKAVLFRIRFFSSSLKREDSVFVLTCFSMLLKLVNLITGLEQQKTQRMSIVPRLPRSLSISLPDGELMHTLSRLLSIVTITAILHSLQFKYFPKCSIG